MTLASLKEYGKLHGRSRQAATRWRDKGALVMRGDLVDVTRSDAKMKGAGLGRFRVSSHGGRRKKGVSGLVDRPGAEPSPALPMSEAVTPFQAKLIAYREAVPTSLGVQIEREIAGLPGDLAELRDIAETVVCWELTEQEETVGWLDWAERAAAAIAADMGIGERSKQLGEVLSRHVLRQLEKEMFRDVDDAREVLRRWARLCGEHANLRIDHRPSGAASSEEIQ